MPSRRETRGRSDRALEGRLLLGGMAVFLVAVPFTLLLLLVVSEWEPLARLDADVADGLNELARSNDWLVTSLEVGEVALDPWAYRLVVLGVVVWLWRRGLRRLALWATVTTVLGGLLTVALKLLVERARPAFDEPVAHSAGYSFPSGHALSSMLCTGVLILVFLPVLGRRGRILAYAVGGFLVLLTGFDRIALGVHYVSDVLAAWVVALACLAGTTAAFEVWRREEGRRPAAPGEGVEPEAADELSESP